MRSLGIDYFHAFEDDLERLSRYIEFTPENYSTYSLELVRLLLTAGSEVEVALKALCKHIAPRKSPSRITDYKAIILPKFGELTRQAVSIPRYSIEIFPWYEWEKKSPSWWRAYNDVKHSRTANYKDGNLGNTIEAIAGLGVIMQYLGSRSIDNFRGFFFANIRFRCLSWNE